MKDTFLGIPIYRFYYPGDRDAVHEECKRLTYRHNGGNRIWDRVFLDGEGGSDLHTFPQLRISLHGLMNVLLKLLVTLVCQTNSRSTPVGRI